MRTRSAPIAFSAMLATFVAVACGSLDSGTINIIDAQGGTGAGAGGGHSGGTGNDGGSSAGGSSAGDGSGGTTGGDGSAGAPSDAAGQAGVAGNGGSSGASSGGSAGMIGNAGGGAGGDAAGAAGDAGAPGAVCTSTAFPTLKLSSVVSTVAEPVFVTSPPSDARLFIVQRAGQIVILKGGSLLPSPFLDISASTLTGGERGLLGLAFHPNYRQNGRFFVFYTAKDMPPGDVVVAEYGVSASADIASPVPVRELARVPHSAYSNHAGGMLAFGPDGRLYVGVGDAGGSGDPLGSAQDLTVEAGKILRLDVDAPATMLAGNLSGRIWDSGLADPWRFSFDRKTGDLYIADPGQATSEEINFEPRGQGAKNYGWNRMEGSRCFTAGCSSMGLTLPVVEYGHDAGKCAVIGGYVYRGQAIPCLAGYYLYADYCTGQVFALKMANGAVSRQLELTTDLGSTMPGNQIVSFGEDAAGELYIAYLGGSIYRIDAE